MVDGNSTPVYNVSKILELIAWNERETYSATTTQPEESKGKWFDSKILREKS